MPIATPGTLILAHLRFGQRGDRVEFRDSPASAPPERTRYAGQDRNGEQDAFHDGGIIVGLHAFLAASRARTGRRRRRAGRVSPTRSSRSSARSSNVKTDEVAVKAIDGATYEIDFPDSAVVTDKNHKKLDRAELKVGTEGGGHGARP